MPEQPHNPSQSAEAAFAAMPQPSTDIGVTAFARVQRALTALSPWARHWLRTDGANEVLPRTTAPRPLLSHTLRPAANTVSLQPAHLMAELGPTVHFAQQILQRHRHQGVIHAHQRASSRYATVLRQATDFPLAGVATASVAGPTAAGAAEDWLQHAFVDTTTASNYNPQAAPAQGEADRGLHPTRPESITAPAVNLKATQPITGAATAAPRSGGSLVAEIRRRIQRASELAATTASPLATQTSSLEEIGLKPDPTKPSLTAAIQERIRQVARDQLAAADVRTAPGAATLPFPSASATADVLENGNMADSGEFSRTAAIREQIRRAELAAADPAVDTPPSSQPSAPRRAEVTEFPTVSRATALREQVRRARRASPMDTGLPAPPTNVQPAVVDEGTVLPSPSPAQPAPQAPVQAPRRQVYSQINEYKTLPPPPARPDPMPPVARALQRSAQSPAASHRDHPDDALSTHQVLPQPWQQEQTTEQPEELAVPAVDARPAMQLAERHAQVSSPAAMVEQWPVPEDSQPVPPSVALRGADPSAASQPRAVDLPAQQQITAVESGYPVPRASVNTSARAADMLQALPGPVEPTLPAATSVTGRGEPPTLFPSEAPSTGLVTATELPQVVSRSNNQPFQRTTTDVSLPPLTVADDVAADDGHVRAIPPTEPTPKVIRRTVVPVAGHEGVVTDPTTGQTPTAAEPTSVRDSEPSTTQAMIDAKVQRLADPPEPAAIFRSSAPMPANAIDKAASLPPPTLTEGSSAAPMTNDQPLQGMSAAISAPPLAISRDTSGNEAAPPGPSMPATPTITSEPALRANPQPVVRRVTTDEGLFATPTDASSYGLTAMPDTALQDTDQETLLGAQRIGEPAAYGQPVATGLSAEQRTGAAETVPEAEVGATTDQRQATIQRSASPVKPASATAPEAASQGATRTIVPGEGSLTSPSVATESTSAAPMIGNEQIQRMSADAGPGNGDEATVPTLSAPSRESSFATERQPVELRKRNESAGQRAATASTLGGSDSRSTEAQDITVPRSDQRAPVEVERSVDPIARNRPFPADSIAKQVSAGVKSDFALDSGPPITQAAAAATVQRAIGSVEPVLGLMSDSDAASAYRTAATPAPVSATTSTAPTSADTVSLHKNLYTNLYRAATHDLPLAQRVIYRTVPTNQGIDGMVANAGAPRTLTAPQQNGSRFAQRAPATDAMATAAQRLPTVQPSFSAADSANDASAQVVGVTVAPSIQHHSVAATGTSSTPLNLDQVARQVLPFIKRLLLIERDRSYWR